MAGAALSMKFELPAYAAVMAWSPTASADVVNVVEPPESAAVPRTAVPSLKVTLPVGVPPPGATGVTVAVNVTEAPAIEGFDDDTTAVVVADLITVCTTSAELWRKLVAPR